MNRLQQLREAAGFSRADMARRSDVTQSVIEQLENGARLEEAERAVQIPGEPSVESISVILDKLADALGANLIKDGISVTSDELLDPATDDLPAGAEAKVEAAEATNPDLPMNEVRYPVDAPTVALNLPPDARSHNETETPDDIDAALSQMAINSQITAAEVAAESGIDEVESEGDWPDKDKPVSPAADTSSEDDAPRNGLTPTGGTETINMSELPDTLPIGVLPDSPPVVETEEISPITDGSAALAGETGDEENPDSEFASQETQEIYIPPEVLAQLPDLSKYPHGVEETASAGDQATQQFELPGDIQNLPTQTEQVDVPVNSAASDTASDAATMKFDLSEVRAQYAQQNAAQTADEPSAIIMAEDSAAQAAEPTAFVEVEEEPEPVEIAEEAPIITTPAIAEIVGTLEPDVEPEPEATSEDAPTVAAPLVSANADPSDDYEAVPMPDMPGPAPAPATMEADSEAHPEPPDMAEVAKEDAGEATTVTFATVPPVNSPTETDLGIHTSHNVDAVTPNLSAPPVPNVEPTPLEVEQATPPQDDGPLTTVEADKEPSMKPYIAPPPAYPVPKEVASSTPEGAATPAQTSKPAPYAPAGTPIPQTTTVSPEAAASDNRYRLPASTVIPSVVGVVAALGWYAWRSWRRSKADAERVAPYYKKK